MAVFIPRFLRQLRDVVITNPQVGDVPEYDGVDWVNAPGGGGGGAPTTADYLVGTAQAGLSAEIVAGATPGGELGGTWGSPTVDTVHSGSSHAQAQAAAEATAAAALAGHDADTTAVHGIADTSVLATDAELQAMLDQAVILAPAASARNTIAPAANVLALRIITPDGDDASKNMIEAYNNGSAIPGNFLFDIDSGGGSAWTLRDPIARFEIDASTGQTGEIFLVYSGDLNQFSGFDKRARLFTQVTTAPADGDVKTGYVYLYYDKTNGAAKLMLKGKTADGTVVTWEIPNGIIGLKSALDDHLADATDAHDASAISFSPTGTVAATDVQAAIAEVASEAGGGGISPTLFDANTVLKADADDTPVALTMGASTILARLAAGNIKAASVAEIITLLQAYTVGATDVAVADGGTGASTPAGALANLGVPLIAPTGVLFQTFAANTAYCGNGVLLATQRVHLVAIWLPSGLTVTAISFATVTTALSGGNHQYFGLYDSALARLAVTADDTSTAWAANSIKKLNLTAPFVTTYSGIHYLAILVDATTVPSLLVNDGGVSQNAVRLAAPKLAGISTTGQTSLPVTAAAITAAVSVPWAAVS